MAILKMHLDSFFKEKDKQNIKIKVAGDVSGLSKTLQKSVKVIKNEM